MKPTRLIASVRIRLSDQGQRRGTAAADSHALARIIARVDGGSIFVLASIRPQLTLNGNAAGPIRGRWKLTTEFVVGIWVDGVDRHRNAIAGSAALKQVRSGVIGADQVRRNATVVAEHHAVGSVTHLHFQQSL